jgi:uncharacterized integral membrane protein
MSNDLHRAQASSDSAPTGGPEIPPPNAPGTDAISRSDRTPRTRTGAAWVGICVAALLFVVLIIFMLQNTSSVEVTFLGLHGNVPLAMALLIAAVGAAILTMVVGAARITQLRRLSRRTRR